MACCDGNFEIDSWSKTFKWFLIGKFATGRWKWLVQDFRNFFQFLIAFVKVFFVDNSALGDKIDYFLIIFFISFLDGV